MQVSKFDLVVSGINRGDNLGLHVIYSGTVGAAREAACKVPQCYSGKVLKAYTETALLQPFGQPCFLCRAFQQLQCPWTITRP